MTDKTCISPLATRPVLYTDTVGGKQTCRDDLWAVTTDELNELHRQAAPEAPTPEDIEQSVALIESVYVSQYTTRGTQYIMRQVLDLLRASPAAAPAAPTCPALDAMRKWDSLPDAKMPPAATVDAQADTQQAGTADCHESCGYIGSECDYPTCKTPAATTASASNHAIADRLSLWLSASLDDHLRQDEYRKHIRAWLEFDGNGDSLRAPAQQTERMQPSREGY